MKGSRLLLALALLPAACAGSRGGSKDLEGGAWRVFRGASDASATAFLDAHTVVVADDEDNTLRTYDALRGGLPRSSVDLSGFLAVDPRHPEADLEGGTRVGDRIYWVTSHGRSRKGKVRESRGRFFATDIVRGPDGATVRPVGRPCTTLGAAIASSLADPRGLNVEALAADPEGRILYLGLRSPVDESLPRARAIVLPLRNPRQVVESGEPPELGQPLLWDLGGDGVRAMEYVPAHRAFFIVAGSSGDRHGWRLYRWSGRAEDPPVLESVAGPPGLDGTPEAIAPVPGGGKVLVAVDDGNARIPVSGAGSCEDRLFADGTCRNKDLADPGRKTFRAFELAP